MDGVTFVTYINMPIAKLADKDKQNASDSSKAQTNRTSNLALQIQLLQAGPSATNQFYLYSSKHCPAEYIPVPLNQVPECRGEYGGYSVLPFWFG